MTETEKAAAYDRLCEMLLVPVGFSATAAHAALEQLVAERNTARVEAESLAQDLVEFEREIDHSHNMLGMVYDQLCVLEHSLECVEQVNLCPTNWCKYWKQPEWDEKRAWYGSAEGKEAVKQTRRARADQLLEWMEKTHPKDPRRLQPLRAMLKAWDKTDD